MIYDNEWISDQFLYGFLRWGIPFDIIYDFRLEYVWFSFGRDVFSEKVTRFFVLGGLYFVVPIQLFDTVILGSADRYVCVS